jgi:hypothetical protein
MCHNDADSPIDKLGYIATFRVAGALNASRKEAEGCVQSEYTAGYLAALDKVAERLGLKTVKEYRP